MPLPLPCSTCPVPNRIGSLYVPTKTKGPFAALIRFSPLPCAPVPIPPRSLPRSLHGDADVLAHALEVVHARDRLGDELVGRGRIAVDARRMRVGAARHARHVLELDRHRAVEA